MGYISYFDLLGTKGFRNGEHEYEENISAFYTAVREGSFCLNGVGEIGLFSDSVYIYSRDLALLLQYLMHLRNTLCSKGLFFNAVVSKGELTSINPQKWKIGVDVYGVGFTDKSIIDLYLEQTKFKGIGIKINEQIKSEVEELEGIYLTNSFYYTSSTYELVPYFDLAYDINNEPYQNKMKSILTCIIKSALKAYSVDVNHGKYYTSLFFTILDSYDCNEIDWTWDNKKSVFCKLPEIFNIIINIAMGEYDECKNWFGIDALCLKIIDMAIISQKISDHDMKAIIKKFINSPFLRKYLDSLKSIPDVFSSADSKNKFINYVQDYFAYDLVERLINGK